MRELIQYLLCEVRDGRVTQKARRRQLRAELRFHRMDEFKRDQRVDAITANRLIDVGRLHVESLFQQQTQPLRDSRGI